ncbi:hypothetical protein PT974_05128 [Cladobotryum mycophilum]|uniref:C2H2-type domain-containing protein n=1 Tax=Cladobotryum mycophilum TaxID=491253 RepID=A0ABR0SR39_9HYPO
MATTILRGFKVSVATLDVFLKAHGVKETSGLPPVPFLDPRESEISMLFHRIMGTGSPTNVKDFRVWIPSRRPHMGSREAYISYTWTTIYAQRELLLDQDLPTKVPQDFETLREYILSFSSQVLPVSIVEGEGRMGLFAVHVDSWGVFEPEEVLARRTAPQYCDQCAAVFYNPISAFSDRQDHREMVHGASENRSPVPNA